MPVGDDRDDGGQGSGHGHSHGHSHGGEPCGGHGHGHGHGEGHSQGHRGDVEGGDATTAPLLENATKRGNDEQRRLKTAAFFALFVMLVEIVGGILANSLAIITDAAHMLSDVGGFIVSLVALQLAARAATPAYTYGFKQAEVVGALLSILIVWLLTGALLYEAAQRLVKLEEINAKYMFGISVIGFVVNLALMQVLGHNHGGGHGHAHGSCSHGHGGGSLAMQAAVAHVIGDIVQSLGVCVAALLIWIQPFDVGHTKEGVSRWNYADPACTVLFGILVLLTTRSTFLQTLDSLMVKAPDHVDRQLLSAALREIPHVTSIHDLHVWPMGSEDVLCTAHLLVEGQQNSTEVLNLAIRAAKAAGIGHSTFQIELEGEFDPRTETHGNLACQDAARVADLCCRCPWKGRARQK